MKPPRKHGGGRPALRLEGQTFGRLTALERVPAPRPNSVNGTYWRCACACGGERVVYGCSLVAGKSRSCGCLVRETAPRNNPHTRAALALQAGGR